MEWSDKFETGMEHLDKDHRTLFMIVNSLHDIVAVEEGHEAATGKSQFRVFERRTRGFPDLCLSNRVDVCVQKTGDCPTRTLSTVIPVVCCPGRKLFGSCLRVSGHGL
ncbi:MAG: hypothetical protein CFH05_01696 [Alphaproteobacteria bacterium MarineAlpha3_Bin4]|nr:MAG: hypothetical protein CFH05_01696 [Alphaproteobacteria bacterium MarineAlpha3_Bin4]